MPYISIVPPTKHDALYKMDFLNKTQAMNEKIAAEMIDTQNVLKDQAKKHYLGDASPGRKSKHSGDIMSALRMSPSKRSEVTHGHIFEDDGR